MNEEYTIGVYIDTEGETPFPLVKAHADFMLFRLFESTSSDNRAIINLLWGYGVFATVIAFAVLFIAVYSIRKFSAARSGADFEFRRTSDESTLELKFGAFALCSVIVMGLISVKLIFTMDEIKDAVLEPDLEVVAHQWWWEIRYPKLGVTTANVAHIPKGKKLLVSITSADVIHDWWVPGLGRKMDAVPGRTNQFYLQAAETGNYEGVCNEFCGQQHAWMRIRVVADEEADFLNWVESEKEDAETPRSESARRGLQLFQDMSCSSCHRIRGTEAQADVGPELTHLASRPTILSGMMDYSKDNLHRWLRDPQSVKQGAYMPRFIFTKQELDDLVNYLDGLK